MTNKTSCGPAGLALIPDQHLITSCGDVLDIKAGLQNEAKAVVFTVLGTERSRPASLPRKFC